MAVIDARGILHGKLGPYVYRRVGNTSILQSKAHKVRQSLSTKESALEFGLASNSAKMIRSAFFPLTYMADGGMINRLNGATLQGIKNSPAKQRGERDLHDADLSFLEGFQFNKQSPLDQALKVRPLVMLDAEQGLKVHIPEIDANSDLQSPLRSQSCVLRLMVVAINFRKNYYEYLAYKDIEIAKGKVLEAQDWQAEAELPAGSIVFLSASLHYFGAGGMTGEAIGLNSKDFSPAEILAAFDVPLAAAEVEKLHDTAAIKRFPLTNYRGEALLKDMLALRKKQAKKQQKSAAKVPTSEINTLNLPRGKVYVQKE